MLHLQIEKFQAENDTKNETKHHGKSIGSEVAYSIIKTTNIASTGEGCADAHQDAGNNGLNHFPIGRNPDGKIFTETGGYKSPKHKADTNDRTGIFKD